MRRTLSLFALFALLTLPALAAQPPAVARGDDLEAVVARMARIGGSRSPSFSPDGRRIAFISDRSGVPQVWMVPSEGGEPRQVTRLEDQVRGVEWSPDGQWLAFSVAPGGGLNEQIYLLDPDRQDPPRLLTEGGQVNNQLAGWSGRWVRFSANPKDPGSLDAYTYDTRTGELKLVAVNPGIGFLSDLSQDGRRAIVQRVKSRGDSNLYLIDIPAGREQLLTPHTPPGTFGGGRFSADGLTIFLGSNQDSDLIGLERVSIGKDGQPGPIQRIAEREDAELDDFEINDQGTVAAVVWNVGGRSELGFLDLASRKLTPGPALPGEIVNGLEFSADGRSLVLTLIGSKLPSDVWVLDVQSGKLRQVTRTPLEGVDLDSLVAPELVTFPAHDGLQLSGWLYRRAGSGPGPVVISFHGGPEAQERPSFNATYQALLSRGIGVFAPNVRGSSGFGKRFVNLDNGALRVNSVKDIKSCVDFLVGRGITDPGRIGIMGGSYGGYMTMAGLTEYPDLFAAGANLFGIVNFETFFSHTQPWMAAISTIEYGDPVKEKELLRQLSPLSRLERVKAPTLVLHGANDTNVPVVEAEQVVDSLKKRGVPVEYVLFPDEGHGFRKTPNRVRSAVSIVRWFEQHLKPRASALLDGGYLGSWGTSVP
ncbi:MAG TPA: S9 family peptidase [Thermoanaerobaculia bacterium]|nr:S9 family peptidase [Thermoanaerobaculia bacterium]